MKHLSNVIILALVTLTPVLATYPCKTSEECIGIEGTECIKERCLCTSGNVLNSEATRCISASSYLLAPCTENIQCQRLYSGFTCDNDTKSCMCQEGFRYLNGRCWPIVEYGEPCLADEQCYNRLLPRSLGCVNGVCGCAPGHYFRHKGYCRKIANRAGASCILSADCQVPNIETVCTGNRCVQKTKALTNAVNTERVWPPNHVGYDLVVDRISARNASEGDRCETNEDCAGLANSECSDLYHCICNLGYYIDETRKICKPDLGKTSTEAVCRTIQIAEYDNGICDCPTGFFYDDYLRGCKRPSRNWGDSCVTDDNCYTFGEAGRCVNDPVTGFLKFCDCDTSISTKDEANFICIPFDRLVGENCTLNAECPISGECLESVCKCVNNTMASSDNKFCLEVDLGLGDECKEDFQCATDRIGCINDKCTCKDLYVEQDNKCIKDIGFPCNATSECEFENSICMEKMDSMVCGCGDDFIQGERKCLQNTNQIGGSCEATVQCSANLGGLEAVNCTEAKCTCASGYYSTDGKCWRITPLGRICTSSSQCYLPDGKSGRAECRNSMCQCGWQYVESYSPDACDGANSYRGNILILLMSIIFTLFVVK